MISRTEVQKIREMYRPGMRIRLLKMDDIQVPPVGAEGTVCGVDDVGSVMVVWDTGSSLSIVLNEDRIKIVNASK